MNKKHAEQKAAMKKAKKRKQTIMTTVICVAIVAVIVTVFLLDRAQQTNMRIYTNGNFGVTLNDDGSFTAQLPHNVRKSGTFAEQTEGAVTTISFTFDGRTEHGRIEGNILIIPDEWDDGCGHGIRFALR